jgi:GMP synthase-like glutamine amidotransferase
MHQDHVTKVPVGFRVLASSPVSPVQIMVLPNRHFCIQGHPEFVSGHIRIVIEARLKKGIFSAEFAEACFAALELPVDDLYFAQVMLKFVQGTIQF